MEIKFHAQIRRQALDSEDWSRNVPSELEELKGAPASGVPKKGTAKGESESQAWPSARV